jgi:hypothetical protein
MQHYTNFCLNELSENPERLGIADLQTVKTEEAVLVICVRVHCRNED